ncbi:very long-chain-fatty-acid--CoA ligase bubblegum [Eurytemora carolleeae]|uniref:very long-chain-fatty-acid--CoA ligase bubblegum n=1 Tax=Eurytemora carolleeae TaxID=1294199 RepID=UPI000C779B98|nr:very long-chain-fatty-acid--CoA ligase bubblegum [Eurytemora carolleeae]|eukprot:XP_023330627.1 very long-chain-fatty-acid--CoA ligase bubblegum-like [Eurytemora affinis]
MRSSRSSIKEPLGKKASGLGKLMSALHQNASSLVTSKPEQNGPNQVLPATEYITSRRNICVKLRKEETGLGAEEPISVPSLIQDLAELYPEVIALKIRGTEAGTWKTWNYNQLYEEIQVVGRAFIETGLQRHHSVAIIGANSPEWIICNMAAIMAGGISVGIQTSLTADEIAKVALDSKADIIVVDQEHQLKKVLLIQHKLPECKAIILIQGEPSIADKRRLHRTHRKHILSWASLQELGQSLSETRLDDRQRRIAINQCCSLVYSSGSHSTPKGVMFSHDNLTWSAKMALGFIRAPGFNRSPAPGEEVLISYLPLSHISTQILDIYYCMTVAGTLVFPSSNILHDGDMFFQEIKTIQPTILYGPPVIFERIYHRLVQLRRSVSGVERFFLDWSNGAVSQKHLQNHSGLSLPGAKPSGSTKIGDIQSKIAKNTVCKKYKESLGLCPNTLYLCRGGPLQDRLLRFLSGFDIVVHSGYGQSETTSFLAANIPKR